MAEDTPRDVGSVANVTALMFYLWPPSLKEELYLSLENYSAVLRLLDLGPPILEGRRLDLAFFEGVCQVV